MVPLSFNFFTQIIIITCNNNSITIKTRRSTFKMTCPRMVTNKKAMYPRKKENIKSMGTAISPRQPLSRTRISYLTMRMLPILKMATGSTRKTKEMRMMTTITLQWHITSGRRSKRPQSNTTRSTCQTRRARLIIRGELTLKMQRIIVHRRHSSGREPLVPTTSLRKNINSLEITSSRQISRWGTQILQPRSLNLPNKLAAPSMALRCGVISARLFTTFAKITQISRQSKMEAKSI